MFRFLWSDPEPDDQRTPIDWRVQALIVGTVFLNLSFWYIHGLDLWPPGSFARNVGTLGCSALLIGVLFFLGPALATEAARQPLFRVAENSLGSVPALGLRVCCVVFLVRWIASLAAIPANCVRFILRRDASSTESYLMVAGTLVFLFVTGLQGLRTTAKLARFTNKLGIAILVAALLRVHDGWPAVLTGFPQQPDRSAISDLWNGLSLLSFYAAPLFFLAADFGRRAEGRKQVVSFALFGLVSPLFGTLLVVGVICVATAASRFYQPSLQPTVAMALWGHAAGSSLSGRMAIAGITVFGAVRFGARTLAESLSIFAPGRGMRWTSLGCAIAAAAWLSVQDYISFVESSGLWVRCLVVAAGVITADFLIAVPRTKGAGRIDWVGAAALVAGWATPLFMPYLIVGADAGAWWHRWLLPSYAVGFLVCILGRIAQRRA